MSQKKKSNALLAVAAMFIGVASIPVAALFSWVIGLGMMALPILMIYNAS